MADGITAYRALTVLLAVVGVAATVFGFAGLYVVLTGGTADEPAGTEVLGEYGCEGFGGDPEPGHEADYEVERTLLGGSEIESFEAASNGTRLRIELAVRGELLDASARRADGTRVAVRTDSTGNRLVIPDAGPAPVRLWVDTVTEDAVVTRTQLDVCPPGSVSNTRQRQAYPLSYHRNVGRVAP